jgi:F0F1-type ATP synthase delta subunit
MAVRVSRRKIAAYCADRLIAGDTAVAEQLAAYLIDEHRTREVELVVRDIEAALAARGVMIADVASATKLSEVTKKAIGSFLTEADGSTRVYLRESLDPSLLGGVRVTTPEAELDATIRRKLTTLKASKS